MSHDGAGHGGFGGHPGHSIDHPGKGHHSVSHHAGLDHKGNVTVEALMLAHAFNGIPGFSDFGHAYATLDTHGMPDHGQLDAVYSGDGVDNNQKFAKSHEAFLLKVEEAKKDPMRRTYGVHVVGHGVCDLPKVFTDLAYKLGAVRVCGTTGNFYPTDVSLNDLTDWNKFSPPYSRRRPPCGWYANACGVTHVWRQYWQVPGKSYRIIKPKGRPLYDRSQSTYIEVQIVTWFFASIGDYETRIDINVVSLPVLDQYDKRWAIRGEPLKNHQRVALGLEEGMYKALLCCPPSQWAQERRDKLIVFQTTRPAEVEKSGADLDTLFLTIPGRQEQFAVPPSPQAAAPSADLPADDLASAPQTAVKAPEVIKPGPAPTPTGKEVTVQVTIPPAVQR